MPRQIRRDLPEFVVRTVQEEGWDGLTNGQLLRRAMESFDVLLTADQRLRHQQNISTFAIGVVVIETYDTRLRNLRRFLPQIQISFAPVLSVVTERIKLDAQNGSILRHSWNGGLVGGASLIADEFSVIIKALKS